MTIITDEAKKILKATILLFSNKTKAEKTFILGIIDTCETLEQLELTIWRMYH